ncbi:MAG: hypothetical protein N2V78_00950 [Methanophagales archaeon]|nr:hypothetical protein [Methanophagales archaeon]
MELNELLDYVYAKYPDYAAKSKRKRKKIEDIPKELTKDERDERIIEDCIKHNAILVTGDKSMQAFAGGKIYNILLKLSAVCGTLRLLSHAHSSGVLTSRYATHFAHSNLYGLRIRATMFSLHLLKSPAEKLV